MDLSPPYQLYLNQSNRQSRIRPQTELRMPQNPVHWPEGIRDEGTATHITEIETGRKSEKMVIIDRIRADMQIRGVKIGVIPGRSRTISGLDVTKRGVKTMIGLGSEGGDQLDLHG